MSPVSIRRFRAERLLRREFEGLRASVLGTVAARLRAAGVELDHGELEAAYGIAWQGLYTAVLEGRQIESPSSWLVVVTQRRAIDEHRARRRSAPTATWEASLDGVAGREEHGELADALDARIRAGQLLEGLAGRLSERERQAATLCYLQGHSRAEAAERMGISVTRMRKLMEGRGAGDPGVSGKLGELARTIEEGGWCESQSSMMRALAYGILDPGGQRYRLALSHHRRCPSCRAYVVALRGIAVALPPALLPAAKLGLAGLTGAADRLRDAVSHLPGGPRSAAAGASGAGGGMALGGPVGAKFAVGCLVALGLGAGCAGVELSGTPARGRSHHAAAVLREQARAAAPSLPARPRALVSGVTPASSIGAAGASAAPAVTAAREFGPEQALAATASGGTAAASAKAGRRRPLPSSTTPATAAVARVRVPAGSRSAEREFAP